MYQSRRWAVGSGHWKIINKSKEDVSYHPRTGVLVQLLQHQVQERSAIFNRKSVCFFMLRMNTMSSCMIPSCFWDNLRYFDSFRENYLDVSFYDPKLSIFTLCFCFSQEPIFGMLILYLWIIVLLLTLCTLLFLFKI